MPFFDGKFHFRAGVVKLAQALAHYLGLCGFWASANFSSRAFKTC